MSWRNKPRRHFSDAELLEALKVEAERLGRTPGIREVGAKDSLCPVERVYRKRFGTWQEALRLAGLEHRGPGKVFGKRGHPPCRLVQFARSQRAQEITEQKRQYWERAS